MIKCSVFIHSLTLLCPFCLPLPEKEMRWKYIKSNFHCYFLLLLEEISKNSFPISHCKTGELSRCRRDSVWSGLISSPWCLSHSQYWDRRLISMTWPWSVMITPRSQLTNWSCQPPVSSSNLSWRETLTLILCSTSVEWTVEAWHVYLLVHSLYLVTG